MRIDGSLEDAAWQSAEVLTDFSQVEVDQERVHLTRFSLFFPEKRDFFVENSGTFAFGDHFERGYRTGASLRDFTLFHSRRIGLTAAGEPIPILGGGRLTGKAGGFEVGGLNMQTRSTPDGPAENFSVVRVRRSLFGRSDLGGIFLHRQPTGDGGAGARTDYGVDGTIGISPSMIGNAYLARTAGTDLEGSEVAGRVALGWRDRLWDGSAFLRQVGEAFDPAVGFVRRSGVRHGYGTVGIHPRPDLPFVQELNPCVEGHYVTDLASVLQTRTGTVGPR